jgi:hypothetical protein
MNTKIFVGVFFVFNAIFAAAQIPTGTWLITGNADALRNLSQGGDNFFLGLAPQAGYFLTDNWMVGLGGQYNYNRSRSFQALVRSRTWSLAPFTRFYLPKQQGAVLPFLALGGGYQQTRNEFSSSETESDLFFLNANVGLNYFFNANVAAEATLGYQGVYPGNAQQDVHSLLWNVGLQIFLMPRTEDETPGGVPIEQGSWLAGFNANSGLANIGESNDLFLSVMPVAGYFLTDHVVVGSGFQMVFADENAIVNPEPFVRYYFISGEAALQPFAMVGFGTRFQLADSSSNSNFFSLNAMAGIGVDWFFLPNVALEGALRYDARRIEEEFTTTELLRLQFGFQVFFQPGN